MKTTKVLFSKLGVGSGGDLVEDPARHEVDKFKIFYDFFFRVEGNFSLATTVNN